MLFFIFKNCVQDLLGGPVVKNIPSNEGDTGLIPCQEIEPYMLWGN